MMGLDGPGEVKVLTSRLLSWSGVVRMFCNFCGFQVYDWGFIPMVEEGNQVLNLGDGL